jgi:hypothetical protein
LKAELRDDPYPAAIEFLGVDILKYTSHPLVITRTFPEVHGVRLPEGVKLTGRQGRQGRQGCPLSYLSDEKIERSLSLERPLLPTLHQSRGTGAISVA